MQTFNIHAFSIDCCCSAEKPAEPHRCSAENAAAESTAAPYIFYPQNRKTAL
jgi:hypothetical protein